MKVSKTQRAGRGYRKFRLFTRLITLSSVGCHKLKIGYATYEGSVLTNLFSIY